MKKISLNKCFEPLNLYIYKYNAKSLNNQKSPNIFAVLTIFKGNNLEIRKTLHIFANEIKNEWFLNNMFNLKM